MTIRHTFLTIATGLALLASPIHAGGPVIVAEDTAPEAVTTTRKGDGALLVIGGLIVLCAFVCGGSDDDAPVTPPGPVCYRKNGC